MNANSIAVFSTFARNLPTMFLSVISRAATGVAAAVRLRLDIMDAYLTNTKIEEKGTLTHVNSIDDLANTSRLPPVRVPKGYMGRVASSIAALAVGLYAAAAPMKAEAASMSWGVQSGTPFSDTDFAIGIMYTVSNNSEPGDANNLVFFQLSAGSNQGVFYAEAPGGWIAKVFDTYTTFTGNGNFIAPNYSGQFFLYGNVPQTTQGTASASSEGNGSFNNQSTWTPVPEPATGALALAGIAMLLRRRRK